MYNKLFTKILDSSIWLESTTTRLVWLTLLAAMDEHGFAQFASASNVAHRARVSVEEAEDALKVLEAPDKDSADKDNEGRRLEKVPGGWMVLNSIKYRDLVTKAVIQEQTRLRVKKFRDHKNHPIEPKNEPCNAPVTHSNESVTPSEAIAEAKESKRSPSLTKSFTDSWCLEWKLFHGAPYIFRTADGVAAAKLLKLEPNYEILIEIAKKAWALNGKHDFEKKHAIQLTSFTSQFNSIRLAVGTLNLKKVDTSQPFKSTFRRPEVGS